MCIWETVLGVGAVTGFVVLVAVVWTYERRADGPTVDPEGD